MPPHRTYALGELVYMTNRLASGAPDVAFTERSGPGMIVEVTGMHGLYRPRYRVKWLKSGVEMVFHEDGLIPVKGVEP
jgi:uncharacterized protein YodC (DUF2158 family)